MPLIQSLDMSDEIKSILSLDKQPKAGQSTSLQSGPAGGKWRRLKKLSNETKV
jgi:hypothetical protein